jgi:sodium/bile acid cotransporter 7
VWPAWLDSFLLGILGAMVLAYFTAPWGSSHGVLGLGHVTGLGIALVFGLHGAQVSRERLHAGSRNVRLHLLIQAATYLAFPALGLCGFWLLRSTVPMPLALGFFYLCALPSTIASAVTLVGIARGNVPAAIFNATLSGLLGIFLTPMLVSLVAATSGVHLSLLDAIRSLAGTVLLPFAVGHLLQRWLLPGLRAAPRLVRFIERGAVLLVMYVAFCDAVAADVLHQAAAGSLVVMLVAVAALLGAMLLGLRTVAMRASLDPEDAAALLLCGSQKSLANGMPMAKALFGAYPALGLLVLPMIAYHQAQLVAGAVIARRYAARTAS